MLRYRALGFVLRDAFPDVLKGVKTVEELQDYPNEEPKHGFNHAKPVEGNVVSEAVKPPTEPAAAHQPNGNEHADPPAVLDSKPSDHQTITGLVERAWPNDYRGKRYYFAKVNGQQLQTTEEELGEALLDSIGKEIRVQVEASPKPGKWYVKAIQQKEFPPESQTEPQPEPAKATPPPPAEQPFAGKIDKAWRQGEPGACVYIARVGGIHVQTRDAAAGEQLLAMEGQNLRAVIRPGTHPSQVHFVRFDEARGVLENPNADRIARRAAAKARHEGRKAPKPAPAKTPVAEGASSREAA
jgi:hypothetical protein